MPYKTIHISLHPLEVRKLRQAAASRYMTIADYLKEAGLAQMIEDRKPLPSALDPFERRPVNEWGLLLPEDPE